MQKENEKIAKEFLELIVDGRIEEAYEKFVDMTGIHHNPFCKAGMAGLRDGMKENDGMFPNKKIAVKHVISDDDMVWVHSDMQLKPGEQDMIAVHILKFQNGKIIEIWDCGQMIPKEHPNIDGAF